MVPDATRNMVIRPANGSAIVFHTNAAVGLSLEAASATGLSFVSTPGNGRSAGDGVYVTRASKSGAIPMLRVAEVHSSGTN